MNCPVCQYHNATAFEKQGVDYHLCKVCDTCYSIPLPNDNKIGGVAEVDRRFDNAERIRRFKSLGCNSLLDFGCGHGWLVEDAKHYGLESHGYDAFNPDWVEQTWGQVDVVSMIEVIEHCTHPFRELGIVWDALKKGGHVYIETSFTDIGRAIGELEDFFYISPEAGHNTIFSHRSLDMLMTSRGFTPKAHINSTVRIYQK